MTKCATCGGSFAAKRSDARFCSSRCRKAASRLSVTERVTDNAPAVTLVPDNANDLATLHDIERRLALGQIDASDYERADAILQAHEQIVIRANQLSVRLEKLLDLVRAY